MNNAADLEVLLGETRAELVVAKRELEEANARITTLTKDLSDVTQEYQGAKKRLNDGLEEIKKAGTASLKLLEGVEDQYRKADAQRLRLLKVTNAYNLAEAVMLATQAGDGRLEELKAEYAKAKIELTKPDE
jgi:chromosome segregation ATPase